jgi:TetR/AcrR family transcriptional regulator, transcriptional repressor for nem operon
MVTTFEINSISVSKAEQTKQRIIEKAAIIFNQNGYAGSSIVDIMKLTGLQKGGIYNHFRSKDEIALAAFDYTVDLLKQTVLSEVLEKTHSIERLHAFIDGFKGFTQGPTIVGGCPILNTAVESDDTHPALRIRAQQAVSEIRALIEGIVALGIRQREIVTTADPREIAIIMLSTLEGAIMLSKLYGTDMYLDCAMNHLHQYVKNHQS